MLKKFLILAMIFFSCSVKSGEIYFPGIDAKDLNKDEFNIPNNLSSEFNIFILSFNRDMQLKADEWFQALMLSNNLVRDVNIFNIPVIPDPGRFVRGFINRRFKGTYKDQAMRNKIIILYVDEKKFFKALDIDKNIRSEPVILLLNKNAKVIYRINGVLQSDKVNKLISFIENFN